jgi:RimJ/RimL family protein N-acetyltransferase
MSNITLKPTDDLSDYKGLSGISYVGHRVDIGKKEKVYKIIRNNTEVGFVGLRPTKAEDADKGFVSIFIKPEFRGQKLAEQAYDALVRRLKLKELFATVVKTNKSSVNAHKNAGFLVHPKTEYYKKIGTLRKDEIRLFKKYNQKGIK